MAIISEIPDDDDGSHVSDQPKKPQENEHKPKQAQNRPIVISEIHDGEGSSNDQSKKRKEDEQKQIQTPNRTISFFSRIPDDLIDICFALVPRCQYPTVSFVSRFFRDLIASSKIFQLRSQLNVTEPVLYGIIGFNFEIPRLYILHQLNSLRLSLINSLPPIMFGSAVVTIGHHMYVIGGSNDYDSHPSSQVILIDCRTHIHIVIDYDSTYGRFNTSIVMEDTIFLFDCESCFSYQPRTQNWESCEYMTPYLESSSCVVDNILYSPASRGFFLMGYDFTKKIWMPVVGVQVDDLPTFFVHQCSMAKYGGNLMILAVAANDTEAEKHIWCVQISLQRGIHGIRAKLESTERVLTSMSSPSIQLCRTVTI